MASCGKLQKVDPNTRSIAALLSCRPTWRRPSDLFRRVNCGMMNRKTVNLLGKRSEPVDGLCANPQAFTRNWFGLEGACVSLSLKLRKAAHAAKPTRLQSQTHPNLRRSSPGGLPIPKIHSATGSNTSTSATVGRTGHAIGISSTCCGMRIRKKTARSSFSCPRPSTTRCDHPIRFPSTYPASRSVR